jgi:uncharacterized tellurite resistance protein B-like protein
MLEDIKRFFADLIDGGKAQEHFAENDYRVAVAALLVHVATLDGELSHNERQRLCEILQARFALDDALTDELIVAAEAADREAVDFYHFTSLLMRTLDEEGRLKIIAMMWEMVLADGRITEFEDNVVWRVADLLGISGRQRVELRQQVAAAQSAPAGALGLEPVGPEEGVAPPSSHGRSAEDRIANPRKPGSS